VPRLADELDDKLVDEALEQMAWLLGPQFVAECEAGYIEETKKLFTAQARIVSGEKKDDDIGE